LPKLQLENSLIFITIKTICREDHFNLLSSQYYNFNLIYYLLFFILNCHNLINMSSGRMGQNQRRVTRGWRWNGGRKNHYCWETPTPFAELNLRLGEVCASNDDGCFPPTPSIHSLILPAHFIKLLLGFRYKSTFFSMNFSHFSFGIALICFFVR
jgi:hypothetical protein